MFFSILTTCFCSLSLTLNGNQDYSQTFHSESNSEKSVIFEGNYYDMSESDAITEINSEDSEEIMISFFIETDDSLEELRSNRPLTITDDLSTAQEELAKYRKRIQENIYSNNLESYSEVSGLFADSDVEIEVSEVNSLITVSLDSSKITEELIDDLNESLNEDDSRIDEIYIGDEPEFEISSTLPETFEKINVSDMVNNGPYDGSGINVGIVEATDVDGEGGAVIDVDSYSTTEPGYDDYYGRNIKIRPGQTALYYHADHVAMIAVGNNGIARGSNILSCYSEGGVESYAGWLLSEGVNVANGSFGIPANLGAYSSQSKLMDAWIRNYFFTFVNSAGNKTPINNDNYISPPGTGFNVITVGNSDDSTLTLKDSSCYREDDTYSGSKPNIVAPGKTITNTYNPSLDSYSGTGTSYAAPQVTGCIALLMEEFPSLVYFPEVILSIITSSASPMSSDYNIESGDNYYDGSGLHNQIGAGLLNYEKMREAANQYITISRNQNSSTGIIPQYIDIVANNKQRIRASSAWFYDEDNFTNYDLELYKLDIYGNMSKVAYIEDANNNVEFIDFDVQTAGTYRLAINQKEQNAAEDLIALSYVLIDDDVGGSTSGAINVDNTLSSHYVFDRSIYEDYGTTYNLEPITEFEYNDYIHTFQTTRKRVRYTEDGKLVLSAKSNDSNYALMEYKFNVNNAINDDWGLYNVTYEFGLWSDDESLIKNSSIDLYGLRHGSWQLIRHFDPKEMSTDPDNLMTYVDCLDYVVNGLRFYVQTNYTNNNNNVGRVVIGNIEGDVHYHVYSSIETYNSYYYKVVCECGDYHLQAYS